MAEPRPAAVSTDGDGVTAWLHAGMSPTLCRYIGRLHVARLVTVIAVFAGVIFLADLIELLRRAADIPVSFPMVMGMAALKVPEALQETLPFATLIATLALHWRLSRASEVVAMRAAGVSPWQLLAPMLAMAFALGILAALVLNPLGAVLLSRFERLEALHLRGSATLLDVAGGGIWLRQADGEGEAVIHATGIAAAFSLRGPRRGGVAMIIGAGVLMGFLLYSLSDIAFALALSAKVPAPLAAWAPAVASMLLGTALLLHLEDG